MVIIVTSSCQADPTFIAFVSLICFAAGIQGGNILYIFNFVVVCICYWLEYFLLAILWSSLICPQFLSYVVELHVFHVTIFCLGLPFRFCVWCDTLTYTHKMLQSLYSSPSWVCLNLKLLGIYLTACIRLL